MRNNNGAVIRKLSGRSFRNNRMRNAFAILAIILTGMLFTAAFSLVSGMIQVAEEETMREVGGRFHAGLKNVTEEQYDKITEDPMVKRSSYNILIGHAENIVKRQAELRYVPQEKDLEDYFIRLEEGRLPEAENEIVVDTIVMDECKVSHALGETIPLTFSFMGKTIQKDFVVSGWYEGDHVSHASELFFSEAYWMELKGDLTDEDFGEWYKEHPEDNGAGLRSGNLFFENTSDLEEKVRTVISNAGYEPGTEVAYGVNWAYMTSRISTVDPVTLAILGGAVLVILLTGYLIIFNIFQISVMSDIRFYGLLKTIGTTKKQIRSMVRRQALIMSVLGIPIGLLAGYGVGKCVLPFAMSFMSYNIEISLKFHPMIFVFGGMFSALTVFLSCRKPGKIAGSVSPIEAVRYTEVTTSKKKKKKRRGQFSLFSMALANLGRNKKKTAVVVAAITLSMVLLTLVMTGVGSFRIEKFMDYRIVGDYMLGNNNLVGSAASVMDYELDDAFIQYADSQRGILEKNELWRNCYGRELVMDEDALAQYRKLDAEGKLEHHEFTEYTLEQVLAGKMNMGNHFYGYTDALLENLTVLEGNLDIEKFQKGDYILIGTMFGTEELTAEDGLYHPGDMVTVQSVTEQSQMHEITDDSGEVIDVWYDNMETKEYEVMAVVDIPHSLDIHAYSSNAMDVVLPLREFTEKPGSNECFAVSYRVEEEAGEEFEAALKDYTENRNPEMGYLSKNTLRKEFSGMVGVISTIGIALSSVIAFIGILNFINAVITGIIARKREFAMLQSIGMTNGQLQKMLVYEGVSYVAAAGIISFCLGSVMAWQLFTALNQVILFFEYRFQILPFLIMIPVLLAVSVAAPLAAYRKVKKKSIVERLRETE
ncbi:MAG: ABC transporter permease [Eubacteriales bacterium]|nr:ABC transporter permease [Eubacteriales bacterium]